MIKCSDYNCVKISNYDFFSTDVLNVNFTQNSITWS